MDEEITDNWIDVDESADGSFNDQETIVVFLKKCRRFISMVKYSTTLTLFFDDERKNLNVKRNLCHNVKCRWNSTFIMIHSLLSLHNIVEILYLYKNHLKL